MKEETTQANLHEDTSSEAGKILHLKRLLVTLKQHYEKCLNQSQVELQAEQNQKIALQKELESARLQLKDIQIHHEEELGALCNQLNILKERLKNSQETVNKNPDQLNESPPHTKLNQQRVEQLERVIPYLRERTEEANLETEQLREELEKAQKKAKTLEQDLVEHKQKAQQDIEHLQQLIEARQNQDEEIESVLVSKTSSHHLRQELEAIKRTLAQGAQESKAFEERYIEVLNEKIGLEHQCKQLQLQLEHQSSNLSAFQAQIHEIEQDKKSLEGGLQEKEVELAESAKLQEELQKKIHCLDELTLEKEHIQDKYEQLKDEWMQLTERLEEALETRAHAEQHMSELEKIIRDQDHVIHERTMKLQNADQDRQSLDSERDQLKLYLEESEGRLKVAQQHLAKKVKEVTLLSERVAEQENSIADFCQTIENQKSQLVQLQSNVELYQNQEKRLQEQLHDALKATESQVSKWEEKYFRMYEKWQESENNIRELQKFKDKHHQMQSLLANLGNFMGGTSQHGINPFFHQGQDSIDRTHGRLGFETPMVDEAPNNPVQSIPSPGPKPDVFEEKFDLFGMRQPIDKSKPASFS